MWPSLLLGIIENQKNQELGAALLDVTSSSIQLDTWTDCLLHKQLDKRILLWGPELVVVPPLDGGNSLMKTLRRLGYQNIAEMNADDRERAVMPMARCHYSGRLGAQVLSCIHCDEECDPSPAPASLMALNAVVRAFEGLRGEALPLQNLRFCVSQRLDISYLEIEPRIRQALHCERSGHSEKLSCLLDLFKPRLKLSRMKTRGSYVDSFAEKVLARMICAPPADAEVINERLDAVAAALKAFNPITRNYALWQSLLESLSRMRAFEKDACILTLQKTGTKSSWSTLQSLLDFKNGLIDLCCLQSCLESLIHREQREEEVVALDSQLQKLQSCLNIVAPQEHVESFNAVIVSSSADLNRLTTIFEAHDLKPPGSRAFTCVDRAFSCIRDSCSSSLMETCRRQVEELLTSFCLLASELQGEVKSFCDVDLQFSTLRLFHLRGRQISDKQSLHECSKEWIYIEGSAESSLLFNTIPLAALNLEIADLLATINGITIELLMGVEEKISSAAKHFLEFLDAAAALDITLALAEFSYSRKASRPNFVTRTAGDAMVVSGLQDPLDAAGVQRSRARSSTAVKRLRRGICNYSRVNAPRPPAVSMQQPLLYPNIEMAGDCRALLLLSDESHCEELHATLPEALARCIILAQIGCFVTCEVYSLPIFDKFYFVDFGDAGDISQGLSSFQLSLKRLSEVFYSKDEEPLVVVKRIGQGTGLQDGTALAWACLEELMRRKMTTVASSSCPGLRHLLNQSDGLLATCQVREEENE